MRDQSSLPSFESMLSESPRRSSRNSNNLDESLLGSLTRYDYNQLGFHGQYPSLKDLNFQIRSGKCKVLRDPSGHILSVTDAAGRVLAKRK